MMNVLPCAIDSTARDGSFGEWVENCVVGTPASFVTVLVNRDLLDQSCAVPGKRRFEESCVPYEGEPRPAMLWLGEYLPRDGGDCENVLTDFRKAGIDLDGLAQDLQSQGDKPFDESWKQLLDSIEIKGKVLQGANRKLPLGFYCEIHF